MLSYINRQRAIIFSVASALVLVWPEYPTEISSSHLRRQMQGNITAGELLILADEDLPSWNVMNATVSFPKASSNNEDSEMSPIMHTFFEPDPKGWCCGMINYDHHDLVRAWEKAWQDKGWATKVLKKEDAMKHPEFEAFSKLFRDTSLSEYNQKCYWRWLAMASIFDDNDPTSNGGGGGGFMSDYDTIPLDLNAEMGRQLMAANDGKFTTYQGHVPSLIHASRVEWDRVLHLMVSAIPEGSHPSASDMITLLKVIESVEDTDIVWRQNVLRSFPYIKTDEGKVIFDCQKVKNMKAVHLSHKASMTAHLEGFYPDITMKRGIIGGRVQVALRVMKDYEEQCKQKEDGQVLPIATQR